MKMRHVCIIIPCRYHHSFFPSSIGCMHLLHMHPSMCLLLLFWCYFQHLSICFHWLMVLFINSCILFPNQNNKTRKEKMKPDRERRREKWWRAGKGTLYLMYISSPNAISRTL
jgi:hypothetical protein